LGGEGVGHARAGGGRSRVGIGWRGWEVRVGVVWWWPDGDEREDNECEG
jgi:hypothetical protein